MKNKLDLAREKINEIDEQMLKLFKERMQASKEVALYKIENSLPVFDETREKTIIERNVNLLDNEEIKEYYLNFFNNILKVSKDYQDKLIKRKK